MVPFKKLPIYRGVLGLCLGWVLITGSGCKTRPTPAPPVQSATMDFLIQASLYMEYASEYKALCYQSYAIAKEKAAYMQTVSRYAKPPCVVLDIDETVLDNGPYTAWQIAANEQYKDSTWKDWTKLAIADTIPGSLGFCKWAKGNGLEVFYVSNRGIDEREATILNLQKHGYPNADTSHVLLKVGKSGDKEPRRQRISETHTIIMLIGDNLGDIHSSFDVKDNAARDALVEQNRSSWGFNWIVLPNPSYGSWESPLWNNQSGLSLEQKNSYRKSALKPYKK